MNPLELLAEARTPDGTDFKLMRRGNEHIILANGKSLMSSRMHGSEEALATFGLQKARASNHSRVLIGGLGMGYTLRATLDLLRKDAEVVVAELVPEVVEWNRGLLAPLAGNPLKDRRVRVDVRDVALTMRSAREQFDAVLLDVDNGPSAFSASANAGVYDDRGLAAAHESLRPGGILAVWSAREDRKFEQRMRYAGFRVEVEHVRGRLKKGGPHHVIFLGYRIDRTPERRY
jgi:spermidine synthase